MLATILTVASSCDKAKEFVRAGQAAGPPVVPPGEGLDLASKPAIVFRVFGETSDPRMIPIAAVQNGKLRTIELSQDGWVQFDALYFKGGVSYPVYRDGRPDGAVAVQRGMWEHSGRSLYTLPGCQTLTPVASVRVQAAHSLSNFTVEFLASTATLSHAHPGNPIVSADVERIGREVSAEVAAHSGIKAKELDSLDFRAVGFLSGASSSPTVVATFIDPGVQSSGTLSSRTTHLLVIADRDSTGKYHATYSHEINGPLTNATFRRYFDHLDLTGDGVDEIVLEGWQFGGDTYLTVLGWQNGKWREVFRSRSNWCLDERRGT